MKASLRKAIESNGYKVYGNLVMVNGSLYPLPLVQGNEKLGKTVWHSSTLPTTKEFTITYKGETLTEKGTCPTNCKGCYACTGNYNFNSTLYSLAKRTELLRRYPNMYFWLVGLQIEHENIQVLRIHASGDFIDGEAYGWCNVLTDCPSVKAWTYTKRPILGEIADLDALPNCNIVKSCIPAHGYNFGHIEYIARTFYDLKRQGETVHICRCGIDKNQHCSDCTGCADNKYVLFVEHSTGYKPEKSPYWNKFIELVNGQDNVKAG